MSTKVVSSPTRNPSRLNLAEDRHYVRVEAESSTFEDSPLEDMLSEVSPTDGDAFKYKLESEDPRDTGHRKMRLLSCSKEDYEAAQKAVREESLANERAANDSKESDFTVFTDRHGKEHSDGVF